MFRQFISYIAIVAFVWTNVVPSYAQSVLSLPAPGTMAELSRSFHPPLLKGLKVYSKDSLRFDFILDKGDAENDRDRSLRDESTRLIKYFLAGVTIPEKDLWVNLSPYEKDRIAPEAFGQTEMGRDLLEQDYLLKQITASIVYPEGKVGKKFWAEIYKRAEAQFGTIDIPIDTFNKVWIVPERAVVYEKVYDTAEDKNAAAAYVVESRLKVMLESDYLATSKNEMPTRGHSAPEKNNDRGNSTATNDISKQVLREVIIPVLEKEVNEGKNFAQLRQVYHSLILSVWYKKKIRESFLGEAIVDQRKTQGIDIEDTLEKDKIWEKYVEAFKKGAYNYIKEESDPKTQEIIPRSYFSGGAGFDHILDPGVYEKISDSAQLPQNISEHAMIVTADLAMASGVSDKEQWFEESLNGIKRGALYTQDNVLRYFVSLSESQAGKEPRIWQEEGVEVREIKANIYWKGDHIIAIPGLYDFDRKTRRMNEQSVEEVERRFGLKAITYDDLKNRGIPINDVDPPKYFQIMVQSVEGHGRKLYLPLKMTVLLKKNGTRLAYFGDLLDKEIPGFDEGDLVMRGHHLMYKGVGTYQPGEHWFPFSFVHVKELLREALLKLGAGEGVLDDLLSSSSRMYVDHLKVDSEEYYDFEVNNRKYMIERRDPFTYEISLKDGADRKPVVSVGAKQRLREILSHLGADQETQDELLSEESSRNVGRLNPEEYYDFKIKERPFYIGRTEEQNYAVFKKHISGWVDLSSHRGKDALRRGLLDLGADQETMDRFLLESSSNYVDQLEINGQFYEFTIGMRMFSLDRNTVDGYRIYERKALDGPLPGPGIYSYLHYQPGVEAYYGMVEGWGEHLAYELQDVYAQNGGSLGEITLDILDHERSCFVTSVNLGGIRSFAQFESRDEWDELSEADKVFVREHIQTSQEATALFRKAGRTTRALLKSGLAYGIEAMRVLKDWDFLTLSQSDLGEFRYAFAGAQGRIQQERLIRNILNALFEVLGALDGRLRNGLMEAYLDDLFLGKPYSAKGLSGLKKVRHPKDSMAAAEKWAKRVHEQWLQYEPYHNRGPEKSLADLHAMIYSAWAHGDDLDDSRIARLTQNVDELIRSGWHKGALLEKITRGLFDIRAQLLEYYLSKAKLDKAIYILGEISDKRNYPSLSDEDQARMAVKVQDLGRQIKERRKTKELTDQEFRKLAKLSQPGGKPVFGKEEQNEIINALIDIGKADHTVLAPNKIDHLAPLLVSWGEDGSFFRHGVSFLIAEDDQYYYALTAAHVVGAGNRHRARFGLEIKERFVEAELVAIEEKDGTSLNRSKDFAVFKIKRDSFLSQGIEAHVLPLSYGQKGGSKKVAVAGFGYSSPGSGQDREPAFGFGYVGEADPSDGIITINNAFADGFSGSPVLDLNTGVTLGIILEGVDRSTSRTYSALSARYIRAWAKGLDAKKDTGLSKALSDSAHRSMSSETHIQEQTTDAAENLGGIDLTTAQRDVNVQTSSSAFEFHFDQQMIERLRHSTGLSPVIVSIQPMTTTLPAFLE